MNEMRKLMETIARLEEGYDRAVMVDGKEVDMQSLSFADVDTRDYPDFADAWIEEAFFVDGEPLSQDQIDELAEEYRDEVYERLMRRIF